jgi:hypothetical protein
MDAISALKLPFNFKIIPVDPDTGLPNNIPFLAMFNPEHLSISESVKWDSDRRAGGNGTELLYKNTNPRSFSVELTLDGTGVNTNGVKIPVTAQILLFRQATTIVDGTNHRPPILIVQYGLFIYKCVMTSSTVNYTMFDMLGLPIRAKITAQFTERTPKSLDSLLSKLSSPDMTHEVEVKEYDILPLLTNKIYKDQQYYLQVARVNKLKNFRKLIPGTTLVFPPLRKP